MAHATRGSDLMQKLNDGQISQVPASEVVKLRRAISSEIEELLEMGARVRPLMLGTERIGWVRGVHMAERKYLRRYFSEPLELAEHLIKLGTTLSPEYVGQLSTAELRSLLRVITEMTNSDLRLYPYIGPFSTTSLSEQLWFSRGSELTGCNRRTIELPEGSRMTLLSAPDQARLWAWLSTYREKSKARLDATSNACLIIRPWAGKGADGLANELKASARLLQPDVIEPWVESIHYTKPISLEDGWAHGEDSSAEGLMRELKGMLSGDRHEQVMAAFDRQAKEKVMAQQQAAEEKLVRSGGPGFIGERREILTAEQARQRVVDIQARRSMKRGMEEELESNVAEKLSRYQ